MLRFLSLDAIQQEYEGLAFEASQLSDHLKQGVNPVKPRQALYGYAEIMQNGWEWLFGYLRKNQPRAYVTLEAGQPALAIGERLWKDRLDPARLHWACNGFLNVGGRWMVFHPEFAGMYIEASGERHPCYSRYLALPSEIAESYYSRMDGLEIVHELPINAMESRILPSKISAWMRAENVCQKNKKNREIMRSTLQGIADNSDSTRSSPEDDFLVMLDTREQNNYEAPGDYLLVQDRSRSGRIFHLQNGDFAKLRVVQKPAQLLDEYVAYVFSGGEGMFDFSAFSTPI